MIGAREITALVDAIVEAFEPEQIILFGSYAYGAPTESSDVDLLVVRRFRGSNLDAAIRVRDAVDIRFPADILVRSPADVRRRIRWGDMFIIDVIERGIVLHESTDRRVGEQGRRRLHRRIHPASVEKAQPV
ncbi:MAG TPA: nucleotidyltransferase domain-containing protein [Tepidisphaeraceae bacterium]|nr:nucleotidyltransferase domain-containing protein [Tepidisphaeraceae bacterium]